MTRVWFPTVVILLGIFLALFYGLINSIENPPVQGRSNATGFMVVYTVLFYIGYTYYFKSRQTELKTIIFTYSIHLIGLLVVLSFCWYYPPFNSEEWKDQINFHYTYDGYPAHRNGQMVDDIIASELLIGHDTNEVINTLGMHYFSREFNGEQEFVYFYQGSTIFDGCDKLALVFKKGSCTKVYYSGCD